MAKIEGKPEFSWTVEELLGISDGKSTIKMLHSTGEQERAEYLGQIKEIKEAAEVKRSMKISHGKRRTQQVRLRTSR